jgi:RecJ-like exonuclease
MSTTIEITILDEDDNEEIVNLPAKMEVCHDCEGHGYVLNESMRNYVYSSEEFYETFDEEEREEYLKRGGRYDVICPTCYGNNVIPVIDREACQNDPELKAMLDKVDSMEKNHMYDYYD